MNNLSSGFFGFLTGVITLATLAVVVSKKADTASVVKAVAGGAAGLISAATAPVTGNTGLGSTQ